MAFSRPIIAVLPFVDVGSAQARPRPSDSPHLVSISAGSAHYCALDDAGTIYCWGDGQWGQLGNGSTASSPDRAVRVASFQQFKQVVAGFDPNVRAHDERIPVLLGCRRVGRHGRRNGPRGLRGGRTSVLERYRCRSRSACDSTRCGPGFEHVCGLVAEVARTAGVAPTPGQLGRAGTMQTVRRSRVQPHSAASRRLPSAQRDERARGTHVRHFQRITRVLGRQQRATTPRGIRTSRGHAIPTRVLATEHVVQLSLGGAHSCAVTSQGGVVCWGTNRHGRIGVTDADSTVGRIPAPPGTRFVEVSVGRNAYLRGDGRRRWLLLGAGNQRPPRRRRRRSLWSVRVLGDAGWRRARRTPHAHRSRRILVVCDNGDRSGVLLGPDA